MRTLFFGCHGPFWRNIPSRPAAILLAVRKHYAPVYMGRDYLQPNLELREIQALTGRTYHRTEPRVRAEQHETLARQFRKHRFYDGQAIVEIYVDDLLDMPSNEEILRCLTTLPAG